jgi:cytidyltransferase-like protein
VIRVYTDVVADLFHWGHVEFFRRARELGDVLVVGVHDDETVAAYKRRPVLTMDERIRVVAGCRWVDEVVPAAPLDAGLLDRHRIDVVVHADDLGRDVVAQWYAEPVARGIYRSVPYTAGISTTDIIGRIGRGADA